jgi:hypothetical protein
MTIREALEIFGIENVRRAMSAFERPSACRWCGCFVGTGLGAPLTDQAAAGDVAAQWLSHGRRGRSWNDRFWAMWTLSGAYEENRAGANRDELRSEAITFLAEHGTAHEPSPAQVHA